MTFTYSNPLEFCWHILKMSLKFFKKLKLTEDFINPGYFSINLKTLILIIRVFRWNVKFAANLTNFSFSRNRLNTFPWWYATVMMPFLFVPRISSYSLKIVVASSSLSTFLALLFSSSVSIVPLFTWESISYCFTSSLSRFVFLTFSGPLHN